MIDGIRFKVCGLTSLADAMAADNCGADFLGFILYPKSPRCVALVQAQAIMSKLPDRRKVAVCVEPTTDELARMEQGGFDCFQIHFRPETQLAVIRGWSERVGADRLWLAPKLPPGGHVNADWLPLAETFLLDAFHPNAFGGTGQTGDWSSFARHREAHPGKTWVLAGGLAPENIAEALRTTGAGFVDVNSGVEAVPGIKDHAKLKRFVVRLHEARTASRK
ncbi:phosphoribosylanthranilate isomerase [Opitutus terrae]|uniref:N-(5'-phosphoribosyl)anthranilate isomerase n=1 Tax=Opitutus terrae (strain DSM 11246 / JCM 15787 / PB90-1) TaxID=452637 RepID=B1ZV84_OPITP|nr:phosphoribosylanthranilate isomerase [Opitutus terrae]ACB76751.1 Phosphoribosylanthranilate isomerase [Opitutus terrae PB90-1]